MKKNNIMSTRLFLCIVFLGLLFQTGNSQNVIRKLTEVPLQEPLNLMPISPMFIGGEGDGFTRDYSCAFDMICCSANPHLGDFDCTQLGNIPAPPISESSAEVAPYQIIIGDFPCGTIIVKSVDSKTMYDFCVPGGDLVTRTVTVFDDLNGNGLLDTGEQFSFCTFTFGIKEDTTPPINPVNPVPLTVQCLNDVPNGIPMTATDNCSGSIAVEPVDAFTPGVCSSRSTVTRTWTFSDDCGNASTTSQIINVVDNSPTISITAPPDQTINCSYNVIPNPVVAVVTTPCGSDFNITNSLTISGVENCPGTNYNMMYTVTDDCGRSASAVQVFTIENEGPEFLCPADICIISCSTSTEEIQNQFDSFAELTTVNSSCSGTIDVANNFDPTGFIDQTCNGNPIDGVPNVKQYQIVTFTATDQCDRTSTCTVLVVVQDNDPPVISGTVSDVIRYCDPLAEDQYFKWIEETLYGMGTIWTPTLTASDVCGGITWSYSPSLPNTNCQNNPFTSTEVTFIATDACGNESTVNALFKLKSPPIQNNIRVAGQVLTENNKTVDNVVMTAEGENLALNMVTKTDGYFEFELPENQNYIITPMRNDDLMNGINTLDLIYIGMHILGMEELKTPYQMIAADVNNSGMINSVDLVELRKLILFDTTYFPNNTSWRFVDSEFVFPNPNNPFESTFPEILSINNLTTELINNFIAIKTGDVNLSAIPNELVEGDTRDYEEISFVVEDKRIQAGEQYTIDFKSNSFTEIYGYQFTLNFDPQILKLEAVTPKSLKGLSEKNFGYQMLNEGILTTSWDKMDGLTFEDDVILFSLTFIALSDVLLSEVLRFSSDYTKAEAYSRIHPRMDVSLKFDTKDGRLVEDRFVLYQNIPNPFHAETTIGFYLPKATETTLSLMDVSGKVLKKITQTYTAGYHEWTIDIRELTSSGLIYYQLKSENHRSSKRMIMAPE